MGEHRRSSLKWVQDDNQRCSHIVLGWGKPGGVWHYMEQSLLTLSLCEWLNLPVYSFLDWKKEDMKDKERTSDAHCKPSQLEERRVTAGDIAKYYLKYVKKMNLADNFLNGVVVNKVERLSTHSLCQTSFEEDMDFKSLSCTRRMCEDPTPSCDRGVCCPSIEQTDTCWQITTKSCCKLTKKREQVVVRAKKLVLACGLTRPRRLHVPMEDACFVMHDMSQFRSHVEHIKSTGKPIVVIGAGMSAADAVLFSMEHQIPLYHAFYQGSDDNSLIFTKLPHGMYCEYHSIWNLMQGKEKSPYYTPLDQHKVVEFLEGGYCVLNSCKDGSLKTIEISVAIVMVGSIANLDFLPDDVKQTLAIDPTQPIDSKHNPLNVDLYSFQSESCPNLYALGPLAGDNFVRFLFGSGLGCAQSILNLSPTEKM